MQCFNRLYIDRRKGLAGVKSITSKIVVTGYLFETVFDFSASYKVIVNCLYLIYLLIMILG